MKWIVQQVLKGLRYAMSEVAFFFVESILVAAFFPLVEEIPDFWDTQFQLKARGGSPARFSFHSR